jgi:cell wall-associated NlpC family hydrolase
VALTRSPRRVRSLLAGIAFAGLAATAAVVLPHVAGATPGQPTLQEVKDKLDKLAKQNEVLAERYNKATAEVKAQQKAADAAQREALSAATDFDKARGRLRQTVTAEYESSSFSHAGALLTSKDGQSYLDTLATLSLVSSHRAEIVAQINAVHTKAQTAQKKATRLLADAQATAAKVDKQKKTIEAQTKKFKDLLASLTAAQQAQYTNDGTVPKAVGDIGVGKAPNAAAQRAVDYSIAQVGKAYVFAASGPDAYDCSGLTMMAWQQGGVSLPHLASAQYNYGKHVSYNELLPGDLIFLYPDEGISHVEIYVGDDLAVSAADEALGIRYVHPSQDMQDWAGATRLA